MKHELFKNPVLHFENLLQQFDKLLSDSGIIAISSTISDIKNDELTQAEERLSSFLNLLQQYSFSRLLLKYDNTVEIVAEVYAFLENEPTFDNLILPEVPNLSNNLATNLKTFCAYMFRVRLLLEPMYRDESKYNQQNLLLASIANKRRIIDLGFCYEFTQGDLQRLKELLGELSDKIKISGNIEDAYRVRASRIIDRLNQNLHKKMTDLSSLWGVIGLFGIIANKYPDELKTFFYICQEILQITWQTQVVAEELSINSENIFIAHLWNRSKNDKN